MLTALAAAMYTHYTCVVCLCAAANRFMRALRDPPHRGVTAVYARLCASLASLWLCFTQPDDDDDDDRNNAIATANAHNVHARRRRGHHGCSLSLWLLAGRMQLAMK